MERADRLPVGDPTGHLRALVRFPDGEQVWCSAWSERQPLPEGWVWLESCPWPEDQRSGVFVCGAKFVMSESFAWWVAIDSLGFVVVRSEDRNSWDALGGDPAQHEAAPLAVIDALRARAGL